MLPKIVVKISYSYRDSVLREDGLYRSLAFKYPPRPGKGFKLLKGVLPNGLGIEAIYDDAKQTYETGDERLRSATITSPPFNPKENGRDIASKIASEENIELGEPRNRMMLYALGAKASLYVKKDMTPCLFIGKAENANDLEETIIRVQRACEKYNAQIGSHNEQA